MPTILSEYSALLKLEPKIIPDPPQELVVFRQNKSKLTYADRERFYSQEHIKDYLEKKWQYELHNRDCFIRVSTYLKHGVDEGGELQHKGDQFCSVIQENKNPYIALKVNADET